jgi:hypothetical protein
MSRRFRRPLDAPIQRMVRMRDRGDDEGTRAFFGRYARLDEEAGMVLAATAHIPTDIRPIDPSRI